MPLLGAIGNASEYSFRGTYDNRPIIIINDVVDADPGGTYVTPPISIKDINYKVPISITGDGEYYIENVNSPEPTYTDQPSYVRKNDRIGLRIFGISPTILEDNLSILPRVQTQVLEIAYVIPITSLVLRSGEYNLPTTGSIQFDNRAFQGIDVGTEFYGKSYSTTITIGKEDYTWNVTTKQAELPTNLSFNNFIDVPLSTELISNTYTVTGLNPSFDYRAEILSSEGTFSVNYNDFVTSSIINNNDILRLKVTSSELNDTEKVVTLRISINGTTNSSATSWSVRTLDNIPSNLSFTNISSAPLKSQVFSEEITIAGLSNGIDFNVNITSGSGLLSVNGSGYVTSAKIRNGNKLKLQLTTSGNWLESKSTTVRIENTSTTWTVTNRIIEVNSDPNASYLIYALPFETTNQTKDISPEVRLKSTIAEGLRSTTTISSISGRTNPSLSTEQSKYYLSSYKLAKGTTTNRFEVTYLGIDTDPTQALGSGNFTIEMWIRASEFGFGGEVGMSIFYPSYIDSRDANDYFLQLYLKGDNWVNSSGYKRGILLGYPNSDGVVQKICETSSQVFTTNTWHHVALTRNGNSFFVWVDGINRASGSISINLTSTRYNFMLPEFQRLIAGDFYVQDLRMYRGLVKYTSNFNTTTSVSSIMEQYLP